MVRISLVTLVGLNKAVVDEATAHLDPETEAAVMGALNNLGIARCLVAHRPGAISQNDRVLLLMNGNAKLINTDGDK